MLRIKFPFHRRPRAAALTAALVLSLTACRSGAQDSASGEAAPQPVDTAQVEAAEPETADPEQDEPGSFRDQAIRYVRQLSASTDESEPACTLPEIPGPVLAVLTLYVEGARVGRGMARDEQLCPALREATRKTIDDAELTPKALEQARFVVELPSHEFSIVEHEGKGLEYVSGLVPARVLDKDTLRLRIKEGTEYLLRVMDPKLGGVHKYYYAPTDSYEERLHTIYTASTLFTLLELYAHDKDESLREPIDRGGEFLLTMQRQAPGGKADGAFHYSLDRRTRLPEPRFVVGTTSKTIFTLIKLHALTQDDKWMDSARRGAAWLMSMQREDGSVSPELYVNDKEEWVEPGKASMLYTGQVLSALSRLHVATKDPQYLEAASRTAKYMLAKVASEGCYLGDEYREPNPISSSWTILSLFDYAHASEDAEARTTVYRCADELLARQINNPEDVYRHGRWQASLSSSGSGWLAEVLSTLYLDCPADDPDHCQRYKDAVIRLLRLLMQYTYSSENDFVTLAPEQARGGLFWNTLDRYVRTDSVCHGMNAYVFMIDELPEGVILELPPAPELPTLAEAPTPTKTRPAPADRPPPEDGAPEPKSKPKPPVELEDH